MFKQMAVAVLVAEAVAPIRPSFPPVQGQSLTQVGWLSGCWALTRQDGVTEEHWMKPLGGTMFGMSRTVRGGKTSDSRTGSSTAKRRTASRRASKA